ncbi:DUF6415 family natural product biosynthesis protein [Streptomyces decoyicus]
MRDLSAVLAMYEAPEDGPCRALPDLAGPAASGELVDLKALLRGHIAVLLPLVRAAADLLWRGSLDWHRRTARIAGIERQVGQGLGDSDFSALVQVQLLARDCRWLLDECTTRLIP